MMPLIIKLYGKNRKEDAEVTKKYLDDGIISDERGSFQYNP